MVRKLKTASKNPEALKRAREFMAEELATHEKKEAALTIAFDALEKRRQVDQELGKALATLSWLGVSQKDLTTHLELPAREIRKLINDYGSPTQAELNQEQESSPEPQAIATDSPAN